MRKIIAAAAGLMMVGAMVSTASAVENKFGGYWRTRAFSQIDFDGQDSGTYARVDTRTRLYYTAIFNENFKFVNKFEMDAIFGGDKAGYGDVGADGIKVEVKNTYADFKIAGGAYKVGTHAFALSKGLMFDTDASGITAIYKLGDITLPFVWYRVDESDGTSKTSDRDHIGVAPVFGLGEGTTIQPFFVYDKQQGDDWNNMYAGANLDMKMDSFSLWATGVYEFGEIDDQDVSAFLFAVGASAGPVHGQFFYASGDDDATDGDIDNFVGPAGQSYYWSEIMGLGTFDNQASAGSPADGISNIMAVNVGAKIKPMDKLTLGGDLWYAMLDEDNEFGDDVLGFEIDLKATYALMDNLKLDVVAAYLLADDATGGGDEDPMEIGARLSLSF